MKRKAERVIVIGGQCRRTGKTALVEDVIRAFPEWDWLAVKITQHHAEMSDPKGHSFQAESDRSGNSDTSRFLQAGATRSFLLQVRPGRLSDALVELCALVSGAGSVIIESNSILDYLLPVLTIFVLDPKRADFKTSARRNFTAADVFVLRSPIQGRQWAGIGGTAIASKPCLLQPIGGPLPILIRRSLQLALTTESLLWRRR